jgi:serine/threonine-protein kinase
MLRSPSSIGKPGPLAPLLLSLREGDLLGERYRIESLVLARASAVHFEATDLTSGTRVSAHVLVSTPESRASAEESVARHSFLEGARRAKALQGAHVARVLDAGVTDDGHPWIVRERIASTTLTTHLREHGALDPAEAVDVTLAICDAIAEAHANDIIHGSLGPHAVHVAWSSSGLVDIKVTGAGTATAEKALSLGSAREVECILRAPEQLRHGPTFDERADVWAIGVLLYTMLAGRAPFAADTPSGASLSVILDDPPPLTEIADELADATLRALAKSPSSRPDTVLELAKTIVGFASNPELAHARIIAREDPGALPLSVDSDPTLVGALPDFTRELVPQEPRRAHQGSRASYEPLVELSPSIRQFVPSALEPPIASRRRAATRELPTVVTRRPEISAFPRRRALKFLGLATATASVVLVVLIGIKGTRISRASTPPPAQPVPVATVAPPPEVPEAPAVSTTSVTRPADAAPAAAPRHPRKRRKNTAAAAAPVDPARQMLAASADDRR